MIAEIYYRTIPKKGELISGDTIKISKKDSSFIAVLSDGLGSGIKASILSTLTASIITKMLEEGAGLEDTIETVIKTLPICNVRKIAYSTFTVVSCEQGKELKIVEYDNPRVFYFRNGKPFYFTRSEWKIFGRKVKISKQTVKPGDLIVVISDGVLFAGLGKTLNLGWGEDRIEEYLSTLIFMDYSPKKIFEELFKATYDLYGGEFGDDASALLVAFREKRKVTVFTGPPLNPEHDRIIVERLLKSKGKKVVCGGTTGKIVGRFLGKEPRVDFRTAKEDVPPIAYLDGIDLLTEGLLTMNKALELINRYEYADDIPDAGDGATKLAKILLESDEVEFLVGQKLNPAYQNPELPRNISLRKAVVNELIRVLEKRGKEIKVEFF